MKRELIAVAILALMFALLLVNIGYLDREAENLLGYIGEAEELLASGDLSGAAERVQKTAAAWSAMDPYTHVFIRHSEINDTTDAIYDLLGDLLSGDAGGAQSGMERLRDHITGMVRMERPALGSIF